VQLQQVLMNLIMNSIDAMKDVDGTRDLVIKSERGEDEQLLISVSDTGVGCPRSRRTRSSMRFLPPNLTHRHGLRISRSIVESHGGRLWPPTTLRAAQVFTLLYCQSRGT